jgi:hypothetical protein
MEDSLHPSLGDYYMDVREFKSGSLEVVVKAIRPMFEGGIRLSVDPDSYSNQLKSLGMGYYDVNGNGLNRIPDVLDDSDAKKIKNHERAVRCAKQNIRWLVKSIEADRLLTLTYRKNQEDREQVKADFKRFLRLVRSGWRGQSGQKDWQYVAVLERQERGAYHIHCAVKGWQRIKFLRAAWYKALGGQGNETGEDTPGNVDVTSPKKARWGTQLREWKAGKLSSYLTKYLAKTFDEDTQEKRRYWHSKDAIAPAKSRFLLCAVSFVDAVKEVASIIDLHYGKAIDFSCSWVSFLGDSLWFSLGESNA